MPPAVAANAIVRPEGLKEMLIEFLGHNGGEPATACQAHAFLVDPAILPPHTRGAVLVRDTTQHGTGPVLRVSPADWARLTATIRAGQF